MNNCRCEAIGDGEPCDACYFGLRGYQRAPVVQVELSHGTVEVVESEALPENAPFFIIDRRCAPLAPGVHRCPCGCDGAFGNCLR